MLICCSVGLALADTLDDLISSRRIEPQLAMRVLQNFDQSISTVLGEKVKARMNFKVCNALQKDCRERREARKSMVRLHRQQLT